MTDLWKLSQEFRDLSRRAYPKRQLRDGNWADRMLHKLKVDFQNKLGSNQILWFDQLRKECDKLKILLASHNAGQPVQKKQRLLTAMFPREGIHLR